MARLSQVGTVLFYCMRSNVMPPFVFLKTAKENLSKDLKTVA